MKSKEEKRKELVDQLEKYLVRLVKTSKKSFKFYVMTAWKNNILKRLWNLHVIGTLILSFNVKFKIPTHKLA